MNKTLFSFLFLTVLLSILVSAAPVTVTIPEFPGAHGAPTDTKLSVRTYNAQILQYNPTTDIFVKIDVPPKNIGNTPPIEEIGQDTLDFLLPTTQSIESQSPTGAVVASSSLAEAKVASTLLPLSLVILTVIAFFVVTHTRASIRSKITVTLFIIFAALFSIPFMTKSQQPTGYLIDSSTINPTATLVNPTCTIVTIGLNTYNLCEQGELPECSDGIDNSDVEDGLIDCADPGCHNDGDASNGESCDESDDNEKDMLEYDHSPVVDNQIDVYDIVNWEQYREGDTSLLIDCDDAVCTGAAANCIGDVDPNADSLVSIADMNFLQTTELNNDDSRTVPGGDPICFNP